jgi:hypothetical protein
MEDQAFSPSFDLVPPPPTLPSVRSTGTHRHKKTEKERQFADGREGGWGGGGAKS